MRYISGQPTIREMMIAHCWASGCSGQFVEHSRATEPKGIQVTETVHCGDCGAIVYRELAAKGQSQ